MKFKLYGKIKEFEELIFKGYKLRIFQGYVAINKRGVEKIINDIYATLPADVENARLYLKDKNVIQESYEQNSDIYKVLKDIDSIVKKANFFLPFAIIEESKLQALDSELKESVPNEISQAEKLNENLNSD